MKKLVQVVATFVFAEVDDEGEIGPTSQPVQVTVSGAEWKREWMNPKVADVTERIAAQLDETA